MSAPGSALFDRLAALFEEGHRADIPDLLTDERFAHTARSTDAAVLIAVTERENPGVILTQRPQDMRDHPGQVAFPGGKIDAGEDAIAAALREAEEEIALSPADVRVIGATDRYQTGTGFEITPVLGVIPPDLPLVANPGEVAAWFEAPLATLLDRASWEEHSAFWRGVERRYLEYHHDGYRIWGVTAAIIANLSRRIAYAELFDA
ncbi:CoA pyrophosphatase [Erythrobacter sp. 3-20A1M]|uniref:CoA pyrophosphatase n=1 Tax=Erythrobacter sp. 3-20A1M TaxID=2653850 RepID=UPI001BFC8AC1|nr:CoA pyrophosphatase [Erythrobacter sp. 3-20A1M]QWC56379.1 CoA pyrophosphatase [Erythrobacter sp. 3-20A1M]